MALVASQADAGEIWMSFATDAAGHTYSIDTNSVRKGIDGLVYFTDSTDGGDTSFSVAVDCQRRVSYLIGDSHGVMSSWRAKGRPVGSGSVAEAELNLICAKAGSGPLPGHWVSIGFGESIDRDSIRRGTDGLAHFKTFDDSFHLPEPDAADCQQRLIYFGQDSGWQDRGRPVSPKSFAEAELNYVCAQVH
jgi:hypothetical protein